MNVSNSEVQCFKRCRRKWWLTYYRRLKPKVEQAHGPRALGSTVHAALAAYYSRGDDGSQLGEGQRSALLWGTLNRQVAEDVSEFPEQADSIRKDAELATAMLEGYQEWLAESGADEGLRVIGPEQELTLDNVVPGVTFMGKLDLRVVREHDARPVVMDTKTVQEFTTPSRTLHLDEQGKSYLLLERLRAVRDGVSEKLTPDGFVLNMLRKVKRTARATPPFYQRVEVRHNDHVLRAFYSTLQGAIYSILHVRRKLNDGREHHEVAYPSPRRECSWDCDFFAVCPLFDDPTTHSEAMVEALYDVGDPYARYVASERRGTV